MKTKILWIVLLGLCAGLLATCTPPASPQKTETLAAVPPTSTYPAASRTLIQRREPQQVTPQPTLEPIAGPNQPGDQLNPADLPPAVTAAQQALAKKLKIPTTEISIYAYDQMDWNDGCLGAAVRDEMCLQVITPGYIIILKVKETSYEIHTDESGNSVRIIP